MTEMFLIILVVIAILAIESKDLLHAAIILAGFSMVLVFIFFTMHALDVAIAEASIGAGVSTVFFVVAISKTKREEK